MSNDEDGTEETALRGRNGPVSHPPYKPPPQFKEISTPTLLHGSLPENAELWLVRIQDNQLKADEFKGKQVALALNASDGNLGCFEDSKGSPFEILDLHNVAGVQPFAFVPTNNNSSLEVRSISRQVAIVRSIEPVALSWPHSNSDQHLSSELEGRSHPRTSQKQKHAPSIVDGGTPSRGAGSRSNQESRAVSTSLSMGVGGFSTVESLQDDEERISTGKLGTPSKKSQRDRLSLNSEAEMTPPASLQKVSEGDEEQASSKKKSRKHKRIKQVESG